jgi:hypothetical protein
MTRNVFILVLAIAGVAFAKPVLASYLGPSLYVQASDGFSSSAWTVAPGGYFYLENFEDGALNTPGVSGSGTILSPGSLTDSVDADDGVLDGLGNDGRSSYSAGNTILTFLFTGSGPGGALPTHVGLVWTDVGFNTNPARDGYGTVQVEAFDAVSVSLGVFGPFQVGDGLFGGQTAEDRFFGAINPGGISRITMTMTDSSDWEVDHLQYGVLRPVPIPAALPMLVAAVGGLGLAGWRSKRRATRA